MKLNYLHISDLHFTYKDMKGDSWTVNAFNQNIVASSMIESIKKIVDEGRSFDFIIITGDIVQSGKREEFQVAEIFINKLLEISGLPKQRLYLTPGNHDINRLAIKPSHLKRWYPFDSQDEISDLLSDPESLDIYMRKFEEFNNFAQKVTGRRLYDETTYHMVDSIRLTKGGQSFRVNIVGLNSSIFAGYDGDDDRKLALGLFQVDRALNQLDEEALFSIGFFHHPFSCFHAEDLICKNRLTNKLDIILTGHLHQPSGEAFHNLAGEAVVIGAGVFYETRETKNSFNHVELDLTTANGKVLFHKYLPSHNLWKPDTDINPHTQDGHFPFSLVAIQKAHLKKTDLPDLKKYKEETELQPISEEQANPVIRFIHNYLLPDNFTGRDEEIDRISGLIKGVSDIVTGKRASLITVKAIGGMGKSCMVRKIVEGFRDSTCRLRYIIWFSFYEARTEDEGFFFQRILDELEIEFKPSSDDNAATQIMRRSEKVRSYSNRTPCLFVLDGLEVIQEITDNKSHLFGKLKSTYGEIKRFLSHICNQTCSMAIVTSRIALKDFSGVSGYLEVPLHSISKEASTELLKKIGVEGTNEEIAKCSTILGGYVLSLKICGTYMAENNIPAGDIEQIIGEPVVFKNTPEGEQITKIIGAYKKDLTDEQVYFLTMLSIHPRSVTVQNFPVLVRQYAPDNNDVISNDIVKPLEKLGLIEVIKDWEATISYSSHPLLKFTFSSWLNKKELKQSHETWAEVAETSPSLAHDASGCKSLDELQPYLDIIDHYMEAGNYRAAWSVYRNRRIDKRVREIGYIHHSLELCKTFEEKVEQGELDITPYDKMFLYDSFRVNYFYLGLKKQMISSAKKGLSGSQETNDKYYILESSSILCQDYSVEGHIKEARYLLKKIKKQNEQANSNNTFIGALGLVESYSGHYAQSISFFRKSITSASQYNQILYNNYLAESLIRLGKILEAQAILSDSLEESEKNNIKILQDELYQTFILLNIKENQIEKAREYGNRRIELRRSMDLPYKEDGFLLVAEGKYDQAIREVSVDISTEDELKYNKADEIKSLLVTSKAWYGKGYNWKATEYFNKATDLMTETWCWREKDRWEEIRNMLQSTKRTIKLPIGISEFDTIINDEYLYIDKTMLIQEVWEHSAQVLLIPRPRRFGKTLNLKMLCSFFERTVKIKGHLFSNLKISKWDKYTDLSGKFPVIFLSFKDVKGDSWKDVSEKIKRIISSEYERHNIITELSSFSNWDEERYKKIIRLQADLIDYEDSLKNLTQYLYNYYQQKIIVLIDEYDMPLQELYKKPYEYEKGVKFIRNLFSGLLKDNANLEKGVLTGILRTAKESVFSGLNNVTVFTVLHNSFSDKFGLTEDEVDKTLLEVNLTDSKEELKSYYNGYNFGNNKIYNPWSVINYLEYKIPDTYWINTSSNDLIHDLIMKNKKATIKDKVFSLLNGNSISVRLDDNIVFSDIDKNEDNVWTFLTFTGYLTCTKNQESSDTLLYDISIPNNEVREFFKRTILEWLEENRINEQINKIHKAILEEDYKCFERELQDISKTIISFYDTAKKPELFYHAFTLGSFIGLEEYYEIDSNRESGYGRYDIMLFPKKENIGGIIIEFKKIDKKEDKDSTLDEAINQIMTKEYASIMIKRGVKKITGLAVVFCGKTVWVKEADLNN
jgi:3',5'-cyclic AMP phosphodiesterase CpdA